jgi:hypothetical protein
MNKLASHGIKGNIDKDGSFLMPKRVFAEVVTFFLKLLD